MHWNAGPPPGTPERGRAPVCQSCGVSRYVLNDATAVRILFMPVTVVCDSASKPSVPRAGIVYVSSALRQAIGVS